VHVALAAGAGLEVEFKVRVTLGDFANMVERVLRQRGAAEVGVQEDTSGIDHRAQRKRRGAAQLTFRCGGETGDSSVHSGRFYASTVDFLSQSIENTARRIRDRAAALLSQQGSEFGRA
jgi:hypothetical protein